MLWKIVMMTENVQFCVIIPDFSSGLSAVRQAQKYIYIFYLFFFLGWVWLVYSSLFIPWPIIWLIWVGAGGGVGMGGVMTDAIACEVKGSRGNGSCRCH